ISNNGEGSRRIGEVLTCSPRGTQSVVNGRMHVLAQVSGRVEGMHMEAVANLPRHAAHILVDASDEDRDVRVVDGSGIEKWRHQVEVIEFALEVERRSLLPGFPDGTKREDDLAQFWSRRLDLYRETPLIVRLHLRSQPEDESSRRS